MDFRKYVAKPVDAKDSSKRSFIPLDKIPREGQSTSDFSEVAKWLGSSSPKEISQIIVGLARDFNAGKIKIESVGR